MDYINVVCNIITLSSFVPTNVLCAVNINKIDSYQLVGSTVTLQFSGYKSPHLKDQIPTEGVMLCKPAATC